LFLYYDPFERGLRRKIFSRADSLAQAEKEITFLLINLLKSFSLCLLPLSDDREERVKELLDLCLQLLCEIRSKEGFESYSAYLRRLSEFQKLL
jgi:hypothetical protein